MPVELQNVSDQAGLPDADSVRQWVELALSRVDDTQIQNAELCVRFVDTQEGAQLNSQFRNIDKATNVLSFPADVTMESAANPAAASPIAALQIAADPIAADPIAAALQDNLPVLLGDLVVCGPVVAAEAVEQGKALTDHAAHLVVHGVLHLLGYDHETDLEAQAMESLEISLLAELDIANPYVPVEQLPAGQLSDQVSS